MSNALADRANAFRELHESPGIFVMPCAWDIASARQFEAAGFHAIGTTSGGVNWSRGRPDYVYSVPKATMLDAYAEIAGAVDVPVSGDLENGYGSDPDDVADTITRSIELGMVGGSIEDQTTDAEPALLPIELAVERIIAAREAADRADITYTLTARAESFFGGVDRPFDDAVERANRYRAAGADCLFVPGVSDLDSIARLTGAVDGPVSVGVGSGGGEITIDALADAGVRRVSTGGSLPRAVFALIDDACRELLEQRTFSFTRRATSEDDVNAFFG